MARDMGPILAEIEKLKSDKEDLLTICASAAVTLRDKPEFAEEMIEFLFSAVDRYGT